MKIAENKAKLVILGANGQSTGQSIDVQYNPDKYSKSWDLTWQEAGQTLQWTKTTAGTFTVTLLFDGYEQGKDVTELTKEIRALLDPSSGKKPMGCLFHWGKVVYKGVVKSIKEDYTLFLQDGTPVRSLMTITLQTWPGEMQNG